MIMFIDSRVLKKREEELYRDRERKVGKGSVIQKQRERVTKKERERKRNKDREEQKERIRVKQREIDRENERDKRDKDKKRESEGKESKKEKGAAVQKSLYMKCHRGIKLGKKKGYVWIDVCKDIWTLAKYIVTALLIIEPNHITDCF